MQDALRGIEGVTVFTDEPMSRHTSLCVGGPADLFVRPHSVEALADTLRTINEADTPFFPLGQGTNVVVRDGGIRGVVVEISSNLSEIHCEGSLVTAQAGVRMAALCKQCCEWQLSGIEFAAGIPGSVGGALVMNAGAYEGEVANIVTEVLAVDTDGECQWLERSALNLGYRKSIFQSNDMLIAAATFALKEDDGSEVRDRMYECLQRRCGRQPVSGRSAGSIFKRPEDDYAGRLLEEADLKGHRIGGAMISNKHAGFIINTGDCTAADIINLIEDVRERVHEAFGVWLEREVVIVGEELPAGDSVR